MVAPCTALAGNLHPERWYQEQWCASVNGTAEVTLDDMTRCDCLTQDHAIELDFARKWAEAIGQALHYGNLTGKKPGIVLIIENDDELRYLERIRNIIKVHGLPVDVWITRP